MSFMKELTKGIVKENPIFVLVLGMCPTLATTTSVNNALGMGLAATFVLVCSNIIISMIRNIIPNKIRIPSYIIVIAAFVSIVDMVMAAYLPDLHK
ncbi:MAG TPA: Rnf-Nqr domain containing protein, partial [Candidatus Syntrophosphaera thermopropionivorans]|nr:Rnf-Nqr domain containing protein [Candidatus Syntrophosphaera thermopropionivorans]